MEPIPKCHWLLRAPDQILANAIILSLDKVFTQLLCVSFPSVVTSSSSSSSLKSSILASQTQQGDCGGEENQPQCNYCHKWGHTKEKSYKLCGYPPRVANVVQTDLSDSSENQSQPSLTLIGANYEEYLKYQASKQSSSNIVFVAHTRHPAVCLTQSSPLRPWVLNSSVSDHISSNLIYFLIILNLSLEKYNII